MNFYIIKVLLYARHSRYEYWSYALITALGPCGAVLLARPKVPKNRHGALPHEPRHPEPDAVTLDCSITEH